VSAGTKFSGRRNSMTAIALINTLMYAGISIVVFVGALAMGMGMVAGK